MQMRVDSLSRRTRPNSDGAGRGRCVWTLSRRERVDSLSTRACGLSLDASVWTVEREVWTLFFDAIPPGAKTVTNNKTHGALARASHRRIACAAPWRPWAREGGKGMVSTGSFSNGFGFVSTSCSQAGSLKSRVKIRVCHNIYTTN